ncbi:MAG: aminotransferase class V-fold PLP-dependent enzyme [Brachybacterium sp.]|nr:aminotransferase class V-fold PLP-dependent enzyme [Brachybacterium sp.]
MNATRAAERAYLDHAATTALRPLARDAFLAAAAVVGNPTSVHTSGRRARAVLDEALESIAGDLGVPRSWVLLTSGGTEADNLAVRGAALAARARDASRTAVLVAATDHPATLATARSLAADGVTARIAPVGRDGLLDPAALAELLADGAVGLASAALLNNETGVIQELAALTAAARPRGTLVHTDAVQAVGHTRLPARGEVDLMSITGHKIGAPVGVGALIADPDVPLAPNSTGGGQQRGVRSGTLDAPHAAALAAALHATLEEAEAESARLHALATRLREGIARIDPTARFTVPAGTPQGGHIVHVCFPGADGQSLLFLLDERGAEVSAGSACSAGVTSISPVLEAMGVQEADARGSVRFSLGWTSATEDIDVALAALPEALERARAVGALTR